MTQGDIQTIQTPHGKELDVHTYLFINNEFVPGNGPLIEVVNPATEEVICSVHSANEDDVNNAVEAANVSYSKVWCKVSPCERGKLIHKLAVLMERDAVELANITVLENGKTYTMACATDVDLSIQSLHYFAGWADKIHGKTIDTTYDKMCYTRHEPLGVVGCVVPWNYPLALATWKLAPALATGNCVVIKSSEITPLSLYKLALIVKEAGFPPGVINIITGYGHTTGNYLTHHPKVNKIAFTGSTATGRKIMEASAKSNLKNIQLELGGKSAQIVCDDADLKNAAMQAWYGVFFNHGQSCSAGSRILVHETVFDEFMGLFIDLTKKTVIGDPFDTETFQGPQINKLQFDKILNYIKVGQQEGAKLVLGGKRWGTKGYFIEPTIFTECQNSMRIMQEEIFGPVVAVSTFKNIEDAIKIANDSIYGLAGGVYTKNIHTAIQVSNQMKAGTVWVNCYGSFDASTPFGGFGQSGFGKDLGEDSLREYTRVKTVKFKLDI
ncbi:aldehyde dehydrogenase domain-containing protein [Pilobolus umbonatus]|nr:aldehyde dehydrogenase domain-containing protein [Pilobolus umbonatus]